MSTQEQKDAAAVAEARAAEARRLAGVKALSGAYDAKAEPWPLAPQPRYTENTELESLAPLPPLFTESADEATARAEAKAERDEKEKKREAEANRTSDKYAGTLTVAAKRGVIVKSAKFEGKKFVIRGEARSESDKAAVYAAVHAANAKFYSEVLPKDLALYIDVRIPGPYSKAEADRAIANALKGKKSADYNNDGFVTDEEQRNFDAEELKDASSWPKPWPKPLTAEEQRVADEAARNAARKARENSF